MVINNEQAMTAKIHTRFQNLIFCFVFIRDGKLNIEAYYF